MKVISITQADDYDVKRWATNIPSGSTLSKAWFTAKRAVTDLDVAAIIQKEITSTLVAGAGQITDTGADGTGRVEFEFTGAQTEVLIPGKYFYDIQYMLSNSKRRTVEKGMLEITSQFTIDTT